MSYIRLGDENNSFFHASVVQHTTQNHINMIIDWSGHELRDNDLIADAFMDFYQGLIGTEVGVSLLRADWINNGPKLTSVHHAKHSVDFY